MAHLIDVREAASRLPRLLELVERGHRVVISRAGEPMADLVPHRPRPITFGTLRGRIQYDDGIFDIDPDIQRMFHGIDGAA